MVRCTIRIIMSWFNLIILYGDHDATLVLLWYFTVTMTTMVFIVTFYDSYGTTKVL